jgi:hypothetical protein
MMPMGNLGHHWAIGLLRLPGGYQPYPVSLRDIERDTAWATQVLERIGIERGKPLHLIGTGCDNEILWPYENALIRMKVPFGVAEPVALDAPRTDMFLRRFRMQAVIGLTGEIVDELLALGRDLDGLLGHSKLIALPDAAAKLRAHGLVPWTMVSIGPIYAFESGACDGARYDESEWLIEEDDGHLLLTSLAPRACPCVRLRTGVAGRVELRRAGDHTERVVHLAGSS